MSSTFDQVICAPVRKHLGRQVRLPDIGDWNATTERGVKTLSLSIPRRILGENLQGNRPASPFFLVCFAYWHAAITGVEPALVLEVTGPGPITFKERCHERRAWIALEALQQGLGDRMSVVGGPEQRWPTAPVFNAPTQDRAETTDGQGREHKVEVQLARNPELAHQFSTQELPINRFRRQLPLGLFEGQVAKSAHWTPGGSAQADLWATSPDGATFHLFELKVEGNQGVGIIPELLVYLWLLSRARDGLQDGRQIAGGGPGIDAVRRAERIIGWTLAPKVHPLLMAHGRTPLEWIAEGLRDHFDLGMLFYEDRGGPEAFGQWWPDRTWRSWAVPGS